MKTKLLIIVALYANNLYSRPHLFLKEKFIASTNQATLYTDIPDVNFENKLITLGIDTDGINGKVLTSSIASITTLDVSGSSISDLTGIADFAALTRLNCNDNSLTALNISSNTALTTVNCGLNSLTTLDVSANTALTSLICAANFLTTLDVSANTALQYLSFFANSLTTLDVSANIALTTLDCFFNELTTLDLSTNTALTTLDCSSNSLITLNVSTNTALTTLDCSTNPLITLDLSTNTALTTLDCYLTGLTTLDVSTNTALTSLACSSNQLTTLDISTNTALTSLDCSSNQLTTLNISTNTALTSLDCSSNQLTTLDISTNTVLAAVNCSANSLTTLDVSPNTALTTVNCSSNLLTNLNLKNGNNTNFNLAKIDFKGNPNLTCIQVDNPTYSNAYWANKKIPTATYDTNCLIALPSNNFTVESKSESCVDSNNGEININATATYPYVATINTTNYNFTNNSLKVSGLDPGTYNVVVSITGETFSQNFTVVIPEATQISGKSAIGTHKAAIEINQGTAPYTVFIDGIEQFETTSSHFSVDIKEGKLLEVKTAKACEGTYTKEITPSESVISVCPNPSNDRFEIALSTSKEEVMIALYTINAQLISKKTYPVENGKVQLTLEDQPTGLYTIEVELNTAEYLKIIKK